MVYNTKIKTKLSIFLSVLFAAAVLFALLTAPVLAEKDKEDQEKVDKKTVLRENLKNNGADKDTEGLGLHADPATFEKNFDLSVEQKKYAITKIEEIVSTIIKPEMSDLEKYYRLAVWENMHVTYDSDFWEGRYFMELYRHQWDAYGVLTDKSVCAGMAIAYANFCHAADLPCKFVRTDPYCEIPVDHTINYVPDINGNAYYLDVTENQFLMTGGFAEDADKDFAGITKDPAESTFEYDDGVTPTDLRECYWDKFDDWFEGSFRITYDNWHKENVLRQETEKEFGAPYTEKGSGEPGVHRASYKNLTDYPAQPYPESTRTKGATGIWFLDDFYKEPKDVQSKIKGKELDEQLLDISGVKKNYDCNTEEELNEAVNNDISISCFPSVKNDEVVAEASDMTKDTDYSVSCESFGLNDHKAIITITGKGEYNGSCSFTVGLNSAVVSRAPLNKVKLVYEGSPQILVKSGKAENGTMVYAACRKGDPEPEDQQYSEALPEKTDAGSYDVWYKVRGENGHADTEPQKLGKPVVIAPFEATMSLSECRTVEVGGSYKLEPSINMEVPLEFTFESEDENIATVSKEGIVKGVSEGSTMITIHAEPEDQDPNYEKIRDMEIIIDVVPRDSSEESEGMTAVYDKMAQVIQTLTDALIRQNEDDIAKLKQQIAELNDQLNKTSKKTNTLTVKGRKVTVRYKSLKKKTKSLKVTKVIKFKKKGQGTKIYAKASGNRKITISKKTGKVTVKKGLKKGLYKVKVRVKAKGNTKYKPSPWKKVTFKVRVK